MIIAKTAVPTSYFNLENLFLPCPGEAEISDVSFKDVEYLLRSNTTQDLVHFAWKYGSVFPKRASERVKPGSGIDFTSEAYKEEVAKKLISLARGYETAKRLMNLAIDLKELLAQKMVTTDDLLKREIEFRDPSNEDIAAAESNLMQLELAKELGIIDMQPSLGETLKADAAEMSLPRFSLIISVKDCENEYSKHLMRGLDHAGRFHGGFEYVKDSAGFSFDAIDRHLPISNEGFREAVKTALDNIIRINLVDVATITHGGIVLQECFTVYSSLWFELAKSFEGGRATRCKACERPMVAIGERGKKRLYCSQACSKWAQRHPGETRSTWRG